MKPKIYLTGSDEVGWALDDDLRLTRFALKDDVELVSIKECEIVHSISWLGLKQLPDQLLIGKRVICHASGEPFRYFQIPGYSRIAQKVGFWVSQTTQAQTQLNNLGVKNLLIPYTVDTSLFHPVKLDDPALVALRSKWRIPMDAYLIGNFHRDTEKRDLSTPKLVKGPDVFIEIVKSIRAQGVPVHVVLAGPRRHWIRCQLDMEKIPYTFIGRVVAGDDMVENILPQYMLNLLYNLLDVYVVSSRSEGGPRSILEASATLCKIISTPVGLALDMLDPVCVYQTPPIGINLLLEDYRTNHLAGSVETHYQKVIFNNQQVNARFRELYKRVEQIDVYTGMGILHQQRGASSNWVYRRTYLSGKFSNTGRVKHVFRKWIRPTIKTIRQKWESVRFRKPPASDNFTVCLCHEFVTPPYGGGNQFMLALREGLLAQGINVVESVFNPDVDIYLLNSIHFDIERFLEYAQRHRVCVLHRIDGPIHLIRGYDREKDELCYSLNNKFASVTIVQSAWTFQRIIENGYMPINPVIVNNAANPKIFHSNGRIVFDPARKIRLISTSWSDNPRKGGPIYKWIEEHLDWNRFEYTFVGRVSESFDRIRQIHPVPSIELANILRQHDIYITASRKDPCSNALIEALSCGLPALYLNDGGHPELVGYGGLPFNNREEILPQLDKLVANYNLYQNLITVQQLEKVTKTYLDLMRRVKNDCRWDFIG
ncbi:MAG TPA: glycosyltransferase [Anaerolineae bacterium]|nr:glycosyltransferase [Anaerolineae bacterium]